VSFVLDNSVALTWCFEDERTPATTALLERVGEAGALAPVLWPLEALNGPSAAVVSTHRGDSVWPDFFTLYPSASIVKRPAGRGP
jgi:hypothetical protein